MFTSQSARGLYDRINASLEQRHKLIVVMFFVLFFIISVCILKDFGLSWDEEYQWKGNGEIVYNYIFNGETEALLQGNEKYHGPAFELILVFIQKALDLTDTREVFLMRHFLTFLTFFISVIFFYYLCKRCFNSWKLALIGCIFLVLSPRIYADAFYNSKDLVLLSFFIIGMLTLLKFQETQTYKNALLHALVCALAIDTRILGIILPLTSLGFIGIDWLNGVITKKESGIRYGSILVFIIFMIGLTILFWPVLWEDPVFHFKAAMVEMSNYHWEEEVLYKGELITAPDLPWHYLPVWICISTPVPYLFFFFAGIFFVARQLVRRPIYFFTNQKDQLLMLICFFLPLLAIIVLKSVVYDAWRHVFFIYPAIILIALSGLKFLKDTLFKNSAWPLSVIIGSVIIFNFIMMVRLHPYENIYFNFLAGKNMQEVKKNFELDYYGLSSKQALEYILEKDPSSKIRFNAIMTPQILNMQLLPIDQRKRIQFADLENADYFIGQYRSKNQHYNFKNEIFSAMVGNASIISVFKLTASEKNSVHPKGKMVIKKFTDFESKSSEWTSNSIYEPLTGGHSGKYVTRMIGKNVFSDGWTFQWPDSLCNKKNLVLKASFWKYEQAGSAISFVVSIDDQNGKNYFWQPRSYKAFETTTGKWEKEEASIPVPAIKSVKNQIKIYILNQTDQQVYIDDINLEFIEQEGKNLTP
jgi:hypothetical protein